MKKTFAWIVAVIIATCSVVAAYAEYDAVNAFAELVNSPNNGYESFEFISDRKPADYLDDVMNGKYDAEVIDAANAAALATDLEPLAAINKADLRDYAAANGIPEKQVRNRYFRALANVVRAEIFVNPASEEYYRNVQIILSLFLDDNDDDISVVSRTAIRSNTTHETVEQIAAGYSLPEAFVEFVIFDDDWNDDLWENDDEWVAEYGWNWSYDDTPAAYDTPVTGTAVTGGTDTAATSGAVNYDNTPDYNTPDYNTPDYNTPDYNTPDKNTPDYNTPDKNTPDYNTPDKNTPDRNTPDYDNTPDD